MTKKDILDYVMETPHNTNRAVLGSMLDVLLANNTSNTNNEIPIITLHQVGANYLITEEEANKVFLNPPLNFKLHTVVNDEEIPDSFIIFTLSTYSATEAIYFGNATGYQMVMMFTLEQSILIGMDNETIGELIWHDNLKEYTTQAVV